MGSLNNSPSPHFRGKMTTNIIMRDVLIALLPATLAGVYFFGIKVLAVVLVSITSCVLTEHVIAKIRKLETTIGDLSAAVTGLLLALVLPPSIPLWIPFIAGIVAIGLAKAVYGGLGHNIFNPALVGRAIASTAWPAIIASAYFWPSTSAAWVTSFDALTTATPLALVKMGQLPISALSNFYSNLFIGNIAGSIGETSVIMLLVGAAYLVIRGHIKLTIPLSYILTVGLITFGYGYDPIFQMLSGGLMLGAFFMATDYVTSPISTKGQLIFGVICGIITAFIRIFGGYPEGVNYAILIANAFVPMIDRLTVRKIFGEVKS